MSKALMAFLTPLPASIHRPLQRLMNIRLAKARHHGMRQMAAFALAALALAFAADPALAQTTTTGGGTGDITTFFQNVVNFITGPVGKSIGVLAIVVSGIGAMFGALSARAFGGVVVGLLLIFSASWVVTTFTGA